MKRTVVLAAAAILLCAAFVGCGSETDPNAATYTPYEPRPAATAPAVTTTAAATTTVDRGRTPTWSHYPEEIEISFTRQETEITMKASLAVSMQGYVIYLPEEYEILQTPGVPDIYMPNANKHSTVFFQVLITEKAAGSALPARKSTETTSTEYQHKTIGGRLFEVSITYELADAERIRPLLLAMVDTMRL